MIDICADWFKVNILKLYNEYNPWVCFINFSLSH